jgi:hypothetical protein
LYEEHKGFTESQLKPTVVNSFRSGRYIGYVDGVTESLNLVSVICLSIGVTGAQKSDMVGKHLRDNPAERNKPASFLITKLMLKTYSCKKE